MTDGLGGAATTDAHVDAPHDLGGPPDDPADLLADSDDLGDPPAGGPIAYEPPWREARSRMTRAWAGGGTGKRIVLALAVALAAALLGAFLFGLWHVVVGGFLKGNWQAGGFGIALASAAGVLLWIEAAVARRLLPRPEERSGSGA
jgi:hypothetical protein